MRAANAPQPLSSSSSALKHGEKGPKRGFRRRRRRNCSGGFVVVLHRGKRRDMGAFCMENGSGGGRRRLARTLRRAARRESLEGSKPRSTPIPSARSIAGTMPSPCLPRRLSRNAHFTPRIFRMLDAFRWIMLKISCSPAGLPTAVRVSCGLTLFTIRTGTLMFGAA